MHEMEIPYIYQAFDRKGDLYPYQGITPGYKPEYYLKNPGSISLHQRRMRFTIRDPYPLESLECCPVHMFYIRFGNKIQLPALFLRF